MRKCECIRLWGGIKSLSSVQLGEKRTTLLRLFSKSYARKFFSIYTHASKNIKFLYVWSKNVVFARIYKKQDEKNKLKVILQLIFVEM